MVPEVIFHQSEKSGDAVIDTLAKFIADCMHEDVVFVDDGAGVRWHFTFPNCEASFDLYKPSKTSAGAYNIDITLRVKDKSEWHFAKDGIDLMDFRQVLGTCYQNGFPRKRKPAYKWSSSFTQPDSSSKKSVHIRTDMKLSPFQKKTITAISESLGEWRATVTAPVNGSYDISFSQNKPIFHVLQMGEGTDRACGFVLEMVQGKNLLFRLNMIDDPFDKFKALMKHYGEQGFDVEGGMWHWGTPYERKKRAINMSKFKNAEVDVDPYVEEYPEAVDVARAITWGLAEERSKIMMDGKNAFKVVFASTYTYVKLVNVRTSEPRGYAFQLYIMKNDEIVYQYSTAGMSVDDIADFFNRHRKEGFKSGDYGTFKWDGAAAETTKPRQFDGVDWMGEPIGDAESISLIADCVKCSLGEDSLSIVTENSSNWRFVFKNRHSYFQLHDGGTRAGYRKVFFLKLCYDGQEVSNFTFYLDELKELERKIKNGVENGFRTIDSGKFIWKTDSMAESEAETTVVLGSSGVPVAVAGVVPDGITSIRAVALKYEGKVIAFRFKTDKGIFDMSKEAAVQYGLSGFKAEKYIVLTSVNGILMSDQEMQRNILIPDVSENESDCRKLISTIFRLR